MVTKKSHRSFFILVALVILSGTHKKSFFGKPLTTAVIGTRVWAGVDSLLEQYKLEAREKPVNRARLPHVGCTKKERSSFFRPETVYQSRKVYS
jgi:hypothetical protein